MVCPPSPGSCLPLSPLVSPLDGVSAFPRVLSPLLSPCAPSCFPLLDGVSTFPRVFSPLLSPLVPLLVSLCWMSPFPRVLSPLVSPCLPLSHFLFPKQCAVRGSQCFLKVSALVLDGVSAFPRVLSPIVPVVVPFCWMVCPPSRGSCLPLSPLVCPFVSPCLQLYPFLFPFVGCPPSRGSCLPLSPLVSLLVPQAVYC